MARLGAASQEEIYLERFLPKKRKLMGRIAKPDHQTQLIEDIRVYTDDDLDHLYYVDGYTT